VLARAGKPDEEHRASSGNGRRRGRSRETDAIWVTAEDRGKICHNGWSTKIGMNVWTREALLGGLRKPEGYPEA
jgi:hypothetical protein